MRVQIVLPSQKVLKTSSSSINKPISHIFIQAGCPCSQEPYYSQVTKN
jgi:hypothetical protein